MVIKRYGLEAEKYIKTWYYIGFVLIIAVLGYGFAAVHPAINVDTLAYDTDYLGLRGDLMRSGRFGGTAWSILFGYNTRVLENSYTISVIGVLLLIWAGLNYCLLFQRASGDTISMPAMTVFSACFVSYPLMNEIWGYQGAIITICAGHLCGSFALLLVLEQLERRKWNFWMSGMAAGLLAVGISAFESYTSAYVFLVFAILFLQERRKPDWKKHLVQGLWYCAALIAGLVAMVIMRKLILVILSMKAGSNGATVIYWLKQPFGETLRSLLIGILNYHILASVLYFPLLTAVVCAGVLVICGAWQLLRRRWFCALLILGMLVSLELLSFVQGTPAPLRACPVAAVFVAFMLMMAASILPWKNIVPLLLCFFCLHQSVYMNRIFTLNYLRYEQEKMVVHDIGRELTSKFDLEKPVVFVGNYRLSSYVMDETVASEDSKSYRLYKELRSRIDAAVPGIILERETVRFPETNIQPVIYWSSSAFDFQYQMESLFGFFGYSIQTMDEFQNSQRFALDYVWLNRIPSYPREGYVVELEDQIIVNLGYGVDHQ